MSTEFESIFVESEKLASELYQLIHLPLVDNTNRTLTSYVACSMALEHWEAALKLFSLGLLPSGVVVQRVQFESLVRSVWLSYAATEADILKLSATLTLESEQAAKNIPSTANMMIDIEQKAPPQAYDALNRFKEANWKALNSYVHSGIHPIKRHLEGYPIRLIEDVTRNTNGLAVLSAMQAVVLSGQQSLQKQVLALSANFPNCMPPPL